MATVTAQYNWISGETVTPAKLNSTAAPTVVVANNEITTAKIADANVTLAKLASAVQQSLVPAGAVQAFAMNSAPSGWLEADGSAVSRSTYSALFSAIGTTHGSGNGSTTFNLPDMRGIFVRGSGSQTISGTSYSGTFAAKQADEFKSHSHALARNVGAYGAGGSAQNVFNILGNTESTASAGGAETRPANIALLYCIKF
jgi:microcystin-dependent protein